MSQSEPAGEIRTTLNYWEIFRELPEPYLLFDATDPDFRIIELNKARERLTGVSRQEAIGQPWIDMLPGVSASFKRTYLPRLRTQLRRMIRSGVVEPIEAIRAEETDAAGVRRIRYWRIVCALLPDASGKTAYVLVSTRDVTEERRRARRAVRTENRLEAALAIGRVGSWTWDVTNDHIVADDNFAKLFAIADQRRDILSIRDVLDAVYPDDRKRVERAIQQSVKQQVSFEEENRLILPNGELRWVLSRGQAEEQDGRLTLTGVMVDITERRNLQAQVELARQQDKLNRQTAKNLQERNAELEAIARSKDEFVALASHQLRTPATAVKQYVGMVLQGYAGDISDTQADMLHKAFESNERQIKIINQILNAARADTGRLVMAPVPLDLCVLVRGVVSDMRTTFEARHHQVRVHVPEHPVVVLADQGYLRMALENVLHNASAYTPENGQIVLRLTQAGGQCRLSVTDTGVGIQKADYSKLFAKFSRIHNPLSVEAGGSGIGLYLTAEIIRLHRGSIDVESQLGKGTTFAISLPVVQNEN